ncbi:hypothetical protein ACFPME_04650 [Rhodanobacter umsongensis]|uniref:Uncharacterized protein n=1 Tax=Rhodanobacter umsongensis TaxID=633153 RepID=A0ABW0JIX0_9GAMM
MYIASPGRFVHRLLSALLLSLATPVHATDASTDIRLLPRFPACLH